MGDVLLRDVVEGDLPVFFEHQCDPEACRMAAFPARDQEAFTTHWRTKVLGNATVAKRTILFRGEVAGHVVAFDQAELRLVGYWLGRDFWGKGIATRALSLFLEEEPARPLDAFVALHNAGSIRVLEKCGFRRSEAPAVTGDDGVEELRFTLGGTAEPRS